jgi:EAL domain-containing protein (putative c-di-GMP-specific phosphodiesterase class I)
MKTTAEGVETQAELECVRAEGCSEVQGYLTGRPNRQKRQRRCSHSLLPYWLPKEC